MMSRMTEKVIQEFHQFLAKKTPQGPKDDEIVSMDVYEYLDMADHAAIKRKKKE